jgi:hypothetical protein
MQYTLSVYDENGKCKVCGVHVNSFHADGCEVGAIRDELKKYEIEIRRLRHALVQINIDTANAINKQQ